MNLNYFKIIKNNQTTFITEKSKYEGLNFITISYKDKYRVNKQMSTENLNLFENRSSILYYKGGILF